MSELPVFVVLAMMRLPIISSSGSCDLQLLAIGINCGCYTSVPTVSSFFRFQQIGSQGDVGSVKCCFVGVASPKGESMIKHQKPARTEVAKS
jgi:hypothetical protein